MINKSSKTGTITSSTSNFRTTSTGAGVATAGATSYDSLAVDKRSLALNSTLDDDLRSYDVFEAHNPMPGGVVSMRPSVSNGGLGSHLSPSGGHASFVDMHDVHRPPANAVSLAPYGASGYDTSYDNGAYRPDTRQSNHDTALLWRRGSTDLAVSQGPPGYSSKPSLRPDSVADMKRELRETIDRSPSGTEAEELNTTTSDTSSSGNEQRPVNSEYQTMDRSLYETSTFRPQQQIPMQSPSGRSLPPPPATPSSPTTTRPSFGEGATTIPSVPGYAKPYAHTGAQRPFEPPPEPPGSRRPLLETSLDEDAALNRPQRSRSVGQMLETNFDEDEGSDAEELGRPGHSRSLGESGFNKLSLTPAALLETDM